MGEYDLTIAAFDKKADQGVSGGLLAGIGWEKEHIKDLCRLFREDLHSVGNFLDVGANIGTFTISLADCLKFTGGRVVAVEGMPPIADHLAVGLLANNLQNNVDLYNYAVGAPDDPKKVTMSLNPVNKGGSAIKGNKPFTEMSGEQLQDLFHPGKVHQGNQVVEVKEYDVPLTTGDLMLKYNPTMKAISVAKVDIEGHEGHFIKGAQQLFSQYPPCILTIELIPEWLERAGTPVEEILDMLVSWGYKDVPSAAQQRKAKSQARTRTITQKNLQACLERVEKYSKEIVRSEPDFSDINALNAVLAREARAKELDAMMVRELDWWQKPHEQRPEEIGKSDSPMIVERESAQQLPEAQA
jgi:FkbM family methyltransferase